jgi:hypothetical protein
METTKQRLARERNWNIVQIKGACDRMREFCTRWGFSGTEQQLAQIRDKLLKENDARWQKYKENI